LNYLKDEAMKEEKKKILYVDDEEINLMIFRHNLANKYNILTAEHGHHALDIMHDHQDINHVITDLRMPEMSGLELVEEARKYFQDKKYFLLTGYSINDQIRKALEEKIIHEYWMKPVNFSKIEAAIDSSYEKID
jgi:response regulator RpfG family c-di-GMP phosphodiesterase